MNDGSQKLQEQMTAYIQWLESLILHLYENTEKIAMILEGRRLDYLPPLKKNYY